MHVLNRMSLFVFVIACASAGARAQTTSATEPVNQTLSLSRAGETVRIPFTAVDGLLMNEKCQADLKSCAAQRAGERAKRTKFRNKGWERYGTPAAAFCKQLRGTPLAFRDEKLNEIGICVFADESMASSWDLFRRAEAKQQAKK